MRSLTAWLVVGVLAIAMIAVHLPEVPVYNDWVGCSSVSAEHIPWWDLDACREAQGTYHPGLWWRCLVQAFLYALDHPTWEWGGN